MDDIKVVAVDEVVAAAAGGFDDICERKKKVNLNRRSCSKTYLTLYPTHHSNSSRHDQDDANDRDQNEDHGAEGHLEVQADGRGLGTGRGVTGGRTQMMHL